MRMLKLITITCVALFLSSCSSTCYDLADKICECELTSQAREACRKKLDMQKSHRRLQLAQDEAVCKNALKTCSCEKLKLLQYDQCALTPTPYSDPAAKEREK